MFYNISQRFTIFHNVLQVFRDVLQCLESCAKIGIGACGQIADAAGIGNNDAKVIPC